MARGTGPNAFVVFGVVLLIVGGLAFVYAQVTIQNQSESDDGSGGALLDVTVEGDRGSDGGGGEQVDRSRVVRLVGLALAAVGAVIALAGSTSNPRHESRR